MQELMRPCEVIEMYPEIGKRWKPADIGYLLRLGLVSGKPMKRGCMVNASEVKRIYDLRKYENPRQMREAS